MSDKTVDFPWSEVVETANAKIREGWLIYQKWTCQHCGARQTMPDANHFYEIGVCEECQRRTDIRSRGCNYMAAIGANTEELKEVIADAVEDHDRQLRETAEATKIHERVAQIQQKLDLSATIEDTGALCILLAELVARRAYEQGARLDDEGVARLLHGLHCVTCLTTSQTSEKFKKLCDEEREARRQ